MTAPTTNEFLTRFPEFGEHTLSVVEGALGEATRSTPESVWGAVHNEAVGYLAAHLLATRAMQMGLQIGSMAGSPTGELTMSSLYGQEYQRLLDGLPICGFVF